VNGDNTLPGAAPPELRFAVEIAPPEIGAWRAGNAGLPFVWSFAAAEPGPHVLLMALMHGNEFAGAIALDLLLRTGVRPARGRLSLCFANPAAFESFDRTQPTASRFVDEDLNRVWSAEELDGNRESLELARARALRPLVEQADIVLDLHSMLWESEPLILCAGTARACALARSLGTPALCVADRGHANGRRLIDYPRFADADGAGVGLLVEAGQHWRTETPAVALAATLALLVGQGLLDPVMARALQPEPPAAHPPRFAEVTETVTAATTAFAFVREVHGGEIIERRNTLIALDGETEVRTPHDRCMLVMPALRASQGHTAVRLARLVGQDARPGTAQAAD